MISCLCVTRGDRPAMLADAVADFAGQDHPDRELVIVHDGNDATDAGIRTIASHHADSTIRVARVRPGPVLGTLRNHAIAEAAGAWVCQWDDDDRYHPSRLCLQWQAAQEQGAAVCYLVDQLHWFRSDGLVFWDDWDREAYPLNLIQGTILARRDILPPYPDLPRGEDTLHTHALLRASATGGFGIARLRDAGWCYVYTCHDTNAWDTAHHRAISAFKHLSAARLLSRLPELRRRLAEYRPGLPALRMPVGSDWIPVSEDCTGPSSAA
jgi:glycosyltransferase involved in cell wall biosynthesis